MSLNADNIISKVARVSLLERDSPKTGKPYVVMTIHFKNGLQIDNFVDKRDWFGLQDLLNTNKNGTSADNPLELENLVRLILPADAGTTLVTSVTGMVTDNLPIILPLIKVNCAMYKPIA